MMSNKTPALSHLAHNELDFIDLAGGERVVAPRTFTQGAVESVVSSGANAFVELVTIPHLLRDIT